MLPDEVSPNARLAIALLAPGYVESLLVSIAALSRKEASEEETVVYDRILEESRVDLCRTSERGKGVSKSIKPAFSASS